MQDTFGSPQQGDQPAKVEKAVNAVDARIKKVMEKVAPMYSRAIGSQQVPADEEFMEYVSVAGTPEERTAHFTNLASGWKAQGFTMAEAVEKALEYERRNEKRLQGYE